MAVDTIQKRSIEGDGYEIRMASEDKREIEGYGIVFNKRFKLWDRYEEEIAPEAGEYFRAKDIDVMSCFNHDFNKILGRTVSDTMRFEVDETGVKYIVKVANTSYGNDLLESVKRGDIRGSSFMFRSKVTEYKEEENTMICRIKEFATVREMGPVANPAYIDTTVAKRSLEDYKKKKKSEAENLKVNDYKSRTLAAKVAFYKV